MPSFLFTTCQVGAESALKAEIAREWPDFRFAYSRPGFVTFKLAGEAVPPEDFDLRSVFARAYGFSLGKATGDDPAALAAQAWRLVGEQRFGHLHVWQRDAAAPGDHGFEPGLSEAARQAGEALLQALPRTAGTAPPETTHAEAASAEPPSTRSASAEAASAEAAPAEAAASGELFKPPTLNATVGPGQRVLDCVLVEPNEWWLGYHRAAAIASRWPGGICPVKMPEQMVSRAYAKMQEALRWSRLPIAPGDACVEIGSAPGGSCQALLEQGLRVLGVDPAPMHPSLLAHPHFAHARRRADDMRRREFRPFQWLVADANVSPAESLATVEAIVTHRLVHVRGLLLTLKLSTWEMAAEIPQWLERVRGWGYQYARARQLAHNRQEICVAALRRRFLRRQA